MKKHLSILPLLFALVAITTVAMGGTKAEKSRFLVISPHTPEECLATLDSVSAMGKETLAKYDWGCMAGDHTAYAIVTAGNEEEAAKIVPESLRSKAKIVKLGKFTVEQIKKLHSQK